MHVFLHFFSMYCCRKVRQTVGLDHCPPQAPVECGTAAGVRVCTGQRRSGEPGVGSVLACGPEHTCNGEVLNCRMVIFVKLVFGE